MPEPTTIRISVRALVEHVYRSGSIESGFRTGTVLTEGTKAHQRIQQEYGDGDRKEVFLSAELPCREMMFALEGRCDGLLAEPDGPTVEEIKSTSRVLADPAVEGRPVHWAQAVCYAYLYALQSGLPGMGIRLTYVHTVTGERISARRTMTLAELATFVAEMLERYYPYAALRVRLAAERDASIRALAFPFEAYRKGQRKLAGSVYTAIAEGGGLFARAPTGVGKTVSTLFPAVKAIGEGKLERIFYLTAKTTTRTAAEDTLALLTRKGGLRLRSVTITAKEKVCFREEMGCSREHCEFADGYYDRLNDAMLDLLGSETAMTREVLERYARKHRLCPFELSLDAAYSADAVICDYNYIYDPRVSLKRLFEEQKRRTALLVDEAHNLLDRARGMYSAELLKSAFLELQRAYKGVDREVHAAAKAMNDTFIAIRKSLAGESSRADSQRPEALLEAAAAFAEAAERALEAGPPGAAPSPRAGPAAEIGARGAVAAATSADSAGEVGVGGAAAATPRAGSAVEDGARGAAAAATSADSAAGEVDARGAIAATPRTDSAAEVGARGVVAATPRAGSVAEVGAHVAAAAAPPAAGSAPGASGPAAYPLLLDTYYAVQAFLRIAKLYDERYVTFTEDWRRDLRVKLLCLDPSHLLRQAGKGYLAKVFFSATLTPLSYYMDMLGGGEDDYTVSIPSPFDPAQWDIRVWPLSTRYRDRDRSYAPIARLIREEAAARPGNHLVFFPSYAYLTEVLAALEEEGPLPDAELLVQRQNMTDEEREAFLAAYMPEPKRTLLGFAVMGGVFSEGIDLAGDRLTGVIVVGVGLPQVNPERELIRRFFDGQGRNGFDYAYVYPGMNKVQQAGGRLIRSETDRGSIVLVDDRFLQNPYRRLLPEEWQHYEIVRG